MRIKRIVYSLASLAALANTALTCTINSVTTFCSDTDAVSMDAGDLFTFRVTYTSGSTGGGDIYITDAVCQ